MRRYYSLMPSRIGWVTLETFQRWDDLRFLFIMKYRFDFLFCSPATGESLGGKAAASIAAWLPSWDFIR